MKHKKWSFLMHIKLLASTVMFFFFTTAAIAQTDDNGADTSTGNGPTTTESGTSDTGMDTSGTGSATSDEQRMSEWSDNINQTFYTDDSRTTLRSDSEIRSSWDQLSPEDQQQVRNSCDSFDSETGTAGTDTNTESSRSGSNASMREICEIVDTY